LPYRSLAQLHDQHAIYDIGNLEKYKNTLKATMENLDNAVRPESDRFIQMMSMTPDSFIPERSNQLISFYTSKYALSTSNRLLIIQLIEPLKLFSQPQSWSQ
jgi:hypothetical protein